MNTLGDVLEFVGVPERISHPDSERFVTVKMKSGGATERLIGSGKSPVPFTGYRVHAGQFVYSRIDARNGAFAIVPESLEGAVVSKDFPIFDIRQNRVDQSYLKHFFASGKLEQEIRSRSRGATNRQRIKEREFLSFPIELPDLLKQRRIAAILDQADALRAKHRQIIIHLNSLSESIFHHSFGDYETSSVLGDVAVIQGGLQVSSRRAELPLEVPYLRVANVYRGRLELAEIKRLQVTSAEAVRVALQKDDLLFVEGHANPMEVGRVALWDDSIPRCVHQNHLIRARLNKSIVLPEFAEMWFNLNRGAQHFRKAGKTTSGLNTISSRTVRSAPIPVPSMRLQEEFRRKIESVTSIRNSVLRRLASQDELFASLQYRAFRGEQ